MKTIFAILLLSSGFTFGQIKIEKLAENKPTARVMGLQIIKNNNTGFISVCYKNLKYKYVADNKCFTFQPEEGEGIKKAIIEGFETPGDMVKLTINGKNVVVKYEKIFGSTMMNFYDISEGNIIGYSDGITKKQFVKFFESAY